MVEQIYRALGRDQIEIGVLTMDAENSGMYFGPPAQPLQFSTIYFKDLRRL